MRQQSMIDEIIRADGDEMFGPTGLIHMLVPIAGQPDIPPWWTRARDIYLSGLTKDDGPLASVSSMAMTKLTNIPFSVAADDPADSRAVARAGRYEERLRVLSGFGEGITETLAKFIADYTTTDNGGFLEIIDDNPDKSQPVTNPICVVHRDSLLVTRTLSREYPYMINHQGKNHWIHYSRMIGLSMNPSPLNGKGGLGYSAASMSVKIARDLNSALNHRLQMMGEAPQRQILFAKRLSAKKVVTTLNLTERLMKDLGMSDFAFTSVLGADDEKADLRRILLNDYDLKFEETLRAGMILMALPWGLSFQEVFPYSQTRDSDMVSLQRTRSLLPANLITRLAAQMTSKLMPMGVSVRFDYRDDVYDHQRALIRDIEARANARMVQSGIYHKTDAWNSMLENGGMTAEEHARLMLKEGFLSDGRPVAALFFSQAHNEILGEIGYATAMYAEPYKSDPDAVLAECSTRKAMAYALMNSTKSSERRIGVESLAALDWLEKEYKNLKRDFIMSPDTAPPPKPEEEEEQLPPKRAVGRGRNEGQDQAGPPGSAAKSVGSDYEEEVDREVTDFFLNNAQRMT